jgi:peptidoglycan-associated lipoprotein
MFPLGGTEEVNQMRFKGLMTVAALMATLMVAGCGGKKAMNEPTTPTETETKAPPVVEETKPPVEQPKPVDMSPISLNDVFFDFDQYALTSEAKGTLGADANELKRVMDATILIEGHCDERGTKAYNLALGDKRANAAKDYLVAMGVAPARISTVSYGKERPFDPGHNEAAWAKNRRAHFVVKK